MKLWIAGLSALVVLCLVMMVATSSRAEDRASWFKSLMQPDSDVSCCDVSDCKRTKAHWARGQWWAEVYGLEMPIPNSKVLDKKSIDGDAYVCAAPASRTIYCFVPPDFGA